MANRLARAEGHTGAPLLVTAPSNVRYLTGLVSSNAAVLVTPTEAILATDDRYLDAARELAAEPLSDAPPLSVVPARDPVEGLAERAVVVVVAAAVRSGASILLVGEDDLTVRQARCLRDAAARAGVEVELVDDGGVVERERSVKDAQELALIRAACDIASRAFRDVVLGAERLPLVGRSERAVAAAVESRMLALGASAVAFPTIVAAGTHGARPHHTATDRLINEGELVTVDFGASVGGYASDCTRTVLAAGSPSVWQREVHELVRMSQQAGIDALGNGVMARDVDAAARGVISAAGLAAVFTHGTGHGVGLDVHEAPMVGGRSEDKIDAGTVVTVEPGVYLPGLGGVRIEDTLAVDEDGFVIPLTDLPRDLVVV